MFKTRTEFGPKIAVPGPLLESSGTIGNISSLLVITFVETSVEVDTDECSSVSFVSSVVLEGSKVDVVVKVVKSVLVSTEDFSVRKDGKDVIGNKPVASENVSVLKVSSVKICDTNVVSVSPVAVIVEV